MLASKSMDLLHTVRTPVMHCSPRCPLHASLAQLASNCNSHVVVVTGISTWTVKPTHMYGVRNVLDGASPSALASCSTSMPLSTRRRTWGVHWPACTDQQQWGKEGRGCIQCTWRTPSGLKLCSLCSASPYCPFLERRYHTT